MNFNQVTTDLLTQSKSRGHDDTHSENPQNGMYGKDNTHTILTKGIQATNDLKNNKNIPKPSSVSIKRI